MIAEILRFLTWKRILPLAPRTILYTYLAIGRRLFPWRYTDADPLKVLWLDPDVIEQEVRDPIDFRFAKLAGGDWDEHTRPFTDNTRYTWFRERFEEDTPWEYTERYQYLKERIENGNPSFRCRTVQELEEECRELDRMYESIQTDGYKTQEELLDEQPGTTHAKNNDVAHPIMNEIGVNIGPDGEFLWRRHGQHRLAMAKILDLDEVPVQVLTRHQKWQDIRDEFRNADSIEALGDDVRQYVNHPDVEDVVARGTERSLE